jgi:hypothetical protein
MFVPATQGEALPAPEPVLQRSRRSMPGGALLSRSMNTAA